MSGLVERRVFAEGERVKPGALMYQIERAPFEIALQQARANLGQRTAELEQARREALRLKPLAEKQAISQRESDQAASTLALSEAAVAQAQAQVREAQLNLSYTSVTAPIAGISGRSLKSEGSLVNPGADSLLTTVRQVDPIWVRFSVSESEMSLVRGTRDVQVQLLGDNGKVIFSKGKLNFAGSTVDPRLGTVQLRAEFPNPELAVLPGQFVRAQVIAGEEQAFLVPQSAVTQTEQGRMVWTIKDGKASPTPVETGAWVGKDWAVRKGLKPGDQVIVDNLIKMRPGAPVTQAAPQPGAPGSAPVASARPRLPPLNSKGSAPCHPSSSSSGRSSRACCRSSSCWRGWSRLKILPIAQYPEIAPPTVTITATYPGASAETLATTVAAPIEEQLSGVENLLYFQSSAASNGQVTITATFEVGTDVDKAMFNVNNRVQLALPRLPDEVRRNGVVVQKRSNNILLVIALNRRTRPTTSCSSRTTRRRTWSTSSSAFPAWATC